MCQLGTRSLHFKAFQVESLGRSSGRRPSLVGGRRGAVLSLMSPQGRRSRSASGPSKTCRAPSPPIEQENPFINMKMPAANVVQRQAVTEVKNRRQKVQSMYSACPPTTPPVATSPPTRRPRSMLTTCSYARPYKPPTLSSTPSLISSTYPRSRSQPPAKRRPLPLMQDENTHVTTTKLALGDIQHSNSQLQRAFQAKEKVKTMEEEEKENNVGVALRRKAGKKPNKGFILSQSMAKMKRQVFERRQSLTKSPCQHLQASPMRLPQFSFLQTLV